MLLSRGSYLLFVPYASHNKLHKNAHSGQSPNIKIYVNEDNIEKVVVTNILLSLSFIH